MKYKMKKDVKNSGVYSNNNIVTKVNIEGGKSK